MSCAIKRVSNDPTIQDAWWVSGTPTIWDPVYANRTTYATPYLALIAAVSARDGQTGYPVVSGSDRVVIMDTTNGIEYAAPTLASLL